MKFGDYLRQQRAAHDWTQPQAAEQIGIEQSYLSKLENNKAVPSEDSFAKLAKAYGFQLSDLGEALFTAELKRLREIQAVRDYVDQRSRTEKGSARRWLAAGLLCLAMGAGIVGYQAQQKQQTVALYTFVSKGILRADENDYLFAEMPTERGLQYLFSVRKQVADALQQQADLSKQITALETREGDDPIKTMAVNEQIGNLRQQRADLLQRNAHLIETDRFNHVTHRLLPPQLNNLLADPLIKRLDYRYITSGNAISPVPFTKKLENGRRVFQPHSKETKLVGGTDPLWFGFGVALIASGLACFYLARRWR